MSNLSTAYTLLDQKRKQIAGELLGLEEKIYDLESDYFTSDCTSFGTVLKGFDGFLTSKNAAAKNKARVFRLEDRMFSLSSYTSKGTQELQEQQAGAMDANIPGARAAAKNAYGKGPSGRRGY